MSIQCISPNELFALRDAGQPVELIDVRTPLEFREVHVEFARNVPLDSLEPAQVTRQRQATADRPLYLICHSGTRGRQACEKLAAAGFAAVVNVEGGTQGWVQAGLPVVRGKKAVSLERQVRITAGALVVLGVVLGWLVHPAFLALSAFVGAGLVYAGVTDTCGMGMILAKMPWNRSAGKADQCAGGSGSRA